jgi:ribosomal protein S18 acetylase RimI-like enzyme
MQIEMRQAAVADIKFLWDVFRVSMKDYITRTRGEWDEQREEAQFGNQLDLLTTQVVHANDLAVGFIMAPIKDGARWIHTICIVPEHQHKGIGTEVLGRVIAQGKGTEDLALPRRVKSEPRTVVIRAAWI